MYKETSQGIGKSIPADSLPEKTKEVSALYSICEALQDAIIRYDSLVYEVYRKLQEIKKSDEPSDISKPDEKEEPPGSVVENLRSSVRTLIRHNDRLESCVRHLNDIV